MTIKTINVGSIARVEGEGALYLKYDDGVVSDVKLKIFEPPRFFEALLRGRDFAEAPDITARICGICPVAYQMSAVHAMERLAGIHVSGPIRDLRRLLYCGEWIESHVLHIFMLHAPDFLGFPSAIEMAKVHGEMIKRGLSLKKMGNALVTLLGGREVHPINVRLGGFYKIPPLDQLQGLIPDLEKARDDVQIAMEWLGTFSFPDFERDYEFVSLKHSDEYPMCEGRLFSSKGIDCDVDEFEELIVEHQVPYTNALQATIRGRGAYLCGPLARFSANYDVLPPLCKEAASRLNIAGGTHNPFKSILVRAVEVLFAFDEAIRILRNVTLPTQPWMDVPPKAAVARAATEAPRGLLFHRYDVDDHGLITDARIIPPTSQNQRSIEEDLCFTVPLRANCSDEELQKFCEQTIRNYDPCISCATHFLKIHRVKSSAWLSEVPSP